MKWIEVQDRLKDQNILSPNFNLILKYFDTNCYKYFVKNRYHKYERNNKLNLKYVKEIQS